jgi:tetratricopeptide (TPR) repeat protein
MIEIDPSFKKKGLAFHSIYLSQEFNNYVDPAIKSEIQKDISDWTEEVNKSTKEIFEIAKSTLIHFIISANEETTSEDAKKLADNEKVKGNEALKSNDYQEALKYYTKSIEYDPNLTASYCNRALVRLLGVIDFQVYLKLKDYQNVIKDCNTTIA